MLVYTCEYEINKIKWQIYLMPLYVKNQRGNLVKRTNIEYY